MFVPPDASPSSRCGGVDALSPFGGALLAAGIAICSTDRLAHPASHADVVSARDAMGEFAARLAFGGFLEPRDASDAWLAEGLASHLAGKCATQHLMGGDELRYRRAREVEAVVEADDGERLPPLASRAARVWRGGRAPGGEGEKDAEREKDKASNRGEGGDAPPRGGDDANAASSRRAVSVPPRALAPETELLLRYKATAVIGTLERRLGDEGMRKVLRKLVNLQGKAPGAEALQERFSQAAKAHRAAREKAKHARDAADGAEGADEAANASAREKAEAAERELRRRAAEERAAFRALAQSPARFLRSGVFFNLCRQNATMTKNEMAAFVARWVEGCGAPRLTVGYTFRKSRRQELLFAIKLDGCVAAAAADRRAFQKNAKISVTVRVQETDLPPSDHAVSLSAHDRAYCLMPLQLVTKPKDRRTIARQQQAALDRQQRAIEEGAVNPDDLDAAAAAEVLQWECPVQWVRVDPESEWLAKVVQPVTQVGLEGMVTAQLAKERPADVASQIAAVAFLRRRASDAGSTSAVNALLQCAEDPKTFCRVRADAARALGECARDGTQRSNLALSGAARAYRRRRCDPATGRPAPTDLSDLAEAVVDEGFVRALGAPRLPPGQPTGDGGRTNRWTTPSECVDLLVDALDHHVSDGDPRDASSLAAAAMAALGATRPPTARATAAAADAIGRWILRDHAVCGAGGRTHAGGRRVSVAAQRALGAMVANLPPLRDVKRRVEEAKKAAAKEEEAEGGANGLNGLPASSGEAAAASSFSSREKKNAAAAAEAALEAVARCVGLARRTVADAVGDACQAVRRAAATLAFDVEARHGGEDPTAGAAIGVAAMILACKAEASGAARAALLWDLRAALLGAPDLLELAKKAMEGGEEVKEEEVKAEEAKEEEAKASKASKASSKAASSEGSSSFARATLAWARASLRAATHRAGAEAGVAAAHLLHLLAGRPRTADEADERDLAARRAADAATLAGVDASALGAAAAGRRRRWRGRRRWSRRRRRRRRRRDGGGARGPA